MSRLVKWDDLLNMRFLSRPAFSPDGTKIAYLVSNADLEKNGYRSYLWLCNLKDGSDRQLTFSGEEKFFCWDGNDAIVFASARGGLPKGKTRFYRLPLSGGEAAELFTVDHEVSSIWHADGRWILKAAYKPVYDNPEKADYDVIDQLPFLANGKGVIGSVRSALAVWEESSRTLKRLSPEYMEVEQVRFSADGRRALFVGEEYRDVKPKLNAVYEIDLASGELSCLSTGLLFGFSSADYYNGAVLVTGSDQKKMGVNQNIQFFTLTGGKLQCLTPNLDSSLHNSVGSDCRYGLAEQSGCFFVDGEKAVYCSTDVDASHLHSVDAKGALATLTSTIDSVDNYDWQHGTGVVAGLKGLQLQELYLVRNGEEKQLTHHNEWMAELSLSKPEHFTFDNGDGWQLDGWYMKPVDCQEGKKYPTILHVHGGPKGVFGSVYFHEMQCWAAKGYAVIYTNPRGSDGRPGGFDDIRGKYGVDDYNDLMVFVDWCVEHLPFVDGKRLGMTGGSYGGYMANWIVTHTDRFKAVCAQRPISNWVSKFGSCDIGFYYVADQHLGLPWKDSEGPWKDSPLRYADHAHTPLLLIQSDEDYRCEKDQSFQMFTAMKSLGVECRMCLFHGDNHELSRSGHPRSRLARLREITTWFDQHLKK